MGAQTGDEHGVGHGTPIQASYALGDDDGSIASARHLAVAFLEQARTAHGLTVSARVMDLTQLVVSELVTNADRHSHGPYILELEGTDVFVTVAVYDSSATLPRRYPRDPQRIGRHGLEIVHALATEVTVGRVPVGKCVKAQLDLRR